MKRSFVPRLDDILQSIALVRENMAGKSYDDFAEDRFFRYAIERAIEIISEASRQIPEEIKGHHPHIPWPNIKTIGNIIRHEYAYVETDVIWDIASNHLQPLQKAIEIIRTKELEKMNKKPLTTRIDQRFAQLKQEGRAAFVAFITAGDPDPETSFEIMKGLPAAGTDVIELGMPFSDPMADGPAIQLSSQRALAAGQTMAKTLDMVRRFRQEDDETPIILMGYYNPVFVYPGDQFLDDAKAAGVDGLIIVDLPPEMDRELCLPARDKGLNFIRLATPTTDAKRLPSVLQNASGFVYYVSIAGITGTAAPDPSIVLEQVRRIKQSSDLPIAVGFGVKSRQQVADLAVGCDGVVVGSAIVNAIAGSLDGQNRATKETLSKPLALVEELSRGIFDVMEQT